MSLRAVHLNAVKLSLVSMLFQYNSILVRILLIQNTTYNAQVLMSLYTVEKVCSSLSCFSAIFLSLIYPCNSHTKPCARTMRESQREADKMGESADRHMYPQNIHVYTTHDSE